MSKPAQKVEIMGAGAMGAFYAHKLLLMDKRSVAFIAKHERYERLKAEGLKLR